MKALNKKVLEKHRIRLNPSLDRYSNAPYFQAKLAEANASLLRMGLPKGF